MKARYLGLCAVALLASCTKPNPSYETNPARQCPTAFWVPDDVAAEFRKYPEGHPMREFFKNYVKQQRAIDEYYTPVATGRGAY